MSIEQNLECAFLLWQDTVEMNGWVNTSVWNRLGETQAISIQSNCSVVQKALQTFFQYCKKQPGDAALGCSSGCFQLRTEPRSRAQHQGEPFHPQLHLRQAVPAWGGEREKRHRIKTPHCWEHWMTNSVCLWPLSETWLRGAHSIERITLKSWQGSDAGNWCNPVFS